MRVLGIDPGSRVTGFGVVELRGSRLRRIASGVIRLSGEPLAARLSQLQRELERVIAEARPDRAALEAVFSHRNARSALLLGQARGAALAACGRAGLVAGEHAPSQVKQAVTGFGGASKEQVQTMVVRLLGLSEALVLDESDALAVAICHGHSAPPRAPDARTRERRARAPSEGV